MTGREIDVAILGGGLAGGLTALALAARRPGLRVLLVEAGPRLGGNHVWSYFASDIPASAAWLVKPLAAAKWRGYGVRFPAFRRQLGSSYLSITSDRLDAALRAALPAEAILTGARVTEAQAHGFTLADGRVFRAGAVIDARGAAAFPGLVGGWQKFVGQMLRLEKPHGLIQPVVIDANLRQHEGFRFVYALPFGPDTVFVEDTYYAASPAIDRDVLAGRIADYAAAQQWTIAQVLGEEQGVLPVVAGGDPAALWAGPADVARIGVGGGFFHPLTGYSLPMAVRMAAMIADLPDLAGAAIAAACAVEARRHWRGGAYYRLLTRMLFGASAPQARYKVFERFYRLDAGLIERFYAGRSTWRDRLRLVAGRPPVPIGAALRSLLGGGVPLARLDDLDRTHHPARAGEEEDL